MDTLESEEKERRKGSWRKCVKVNRRDQVRTPPVLLQKEVFDALKRSNAEWKVTRRKQMKRCISLMKKWKVTRRKQ